MTPQDKALRLARKYAAEEIVRLDADSQRSHNYASEVLSGKCDDSSLAIQAALAAILKTSELGAEYVRNHNPISTTNGPEMRPRLEGNLDGLAYANALRSLDHLPEGDG